MTNKEAIKKLEEIRDATEAWYGLSEDGRDMFWLAISALNYVEFMKGVSTCKDCKHRYVDGDGVRYNVCELNHNKAQSDEWFCADGERKDGEVDG